MIGYWDNDKNVYVKQCKACGYAYAEEFSESGYYKPVIGDEKFIELGVIIREGGYGIFQKEELYACPKCGTVHIAV